MTDRVAHDDEADPRGLILEAYRIEGISEPECRAIFLDWTLDDTGSLSTLAAVKLLLARYGETAPEHPMTAVLRAALRGAPAPRRRGGYKGRKRP